jgi:hypothetical protein
MKKYILSLVMLVFSFVVVSQTIVAEISEWSTFECGFTEEYDTIVSNPNIIILGYGFGENRLTFDLGTKTYKFFFLNQEFSNGSMEYKIKDGVYIFTCQTIDNNTNEPMDLFVTVNTNPQKTNEPYVTQFYSDVNTNKSYGMVSHFK